MHQEFVRYAGIPLPKPDSRVEYDDVALPDYEAESQES